MTRTLAFRNWRTGQVYQPIDVSQESDHSIQRIRRGMEINIGEDWYVIDSADNPELFEPALTKGDATLHGWQPIETAPKDGTKIDLLFPYPRGRTIDCFWGYSALKGGKTWIWQTPTWKGDELLPEKQWDVHCYGNAEPIAWMLFSQTHDAGPITVANGPGDHFAAGFLAGSRSQSAQIEELREALQTIRLEAEAIAKTYGHFVVETIILECDAALAATIGDA